MLDGDIIREIFGNDLGFKERDRIRQIRRIQGLARELERQGLVVLVGALYARADLLAWNRENFSTYFEIYLDASLALVREHDANGLYGKAARGEMASVVGIDIPWHAPTRADLHITVTRAIRPDDLAIEVASRIPRFTAALRRQAEDVA